MPLDAMRAPSLRRRMACFVYEGVLLFGVLTIAALAYGVLTEQRHALAGMHGLQALLFIVLGLYFTWFWTHGGQTLAMQTWRIRLLARDGNPVGRIRAALRYLLSWLWFLPALAYGGFAGPRTGGAIAGALALGVVAYAALARFLPDRQFVHDLIAGTRLVHQERPAPRG